MNKKKKIILFSSMGIGSISILCAGIGYIAVALNSNYSVLDNITKRRNEIYNKLKSMHVKIENKYMYCAHIENEKPTTIILENITDKEKPKKYIINKNQYLKLPIKYGKYNIIAKQDNKKIKFQFQWIDESIEITNEKIQNFKFQNPIDKSKEDVLTDKEKAQSIIQKYFTIWEIIEDFKKEENKKEIEKQIKEKIEKINSNTKEARDLFQNITLREGRLIDYKSNIIDATKKVIENSFSFKTKDQEFWLIKSNMNIDSITNELYKDMLNSKEFKVLGTIAKPQQWLKEDKKISISINDTSYSILIKNYNSQKESDLQKNIINNLIKYLENHLE